MQLGSGLSIHYAFEVERAEPPALGDRYRDPRGHLWYVRGLRPERSVKLRDPLPEHPIWEVQLEGEHVAYTLGIGEELEALQESRSVGSLYRKEDDTFGFGTVVRGGDGFSWVFWANETKWRLQVGPMVSSYNAFSATLFTLGGEYQRDPGTLPWALVTKGLEMFNQT